MYNVGEVEDTRFWLPVALWQASLPLESSITLRVQQDDKLKANSMMLGAGYGPVGGGYGNAGQSTVTGTPQNPLGSHFPNFLAMTQGEAHPRAAMPLPNKIAVPRRAALSVSLDITEYGQALLNAIQGPGTITAFNTGFSGNVELPVMFGVTLRLNGRRLVQQRGQLHA